LLRRLLRLYRLLWMDERVAALEARNKRLQSQLTNLRTTVQAQQKLLQNQGDVSRSHGDTLQDHRAALEKQRNALQNQRRSVLEQVDLVRSSLEVTPAMVEEFFEWKERNPVPERPLVTVAVATYNRSELLTQRCIPSVLNQTYGNLELIVVGDGCTDDTEDRVAEIKDPRLKFLNLPERSTYPAAPERQWMVAGTLPTNTALSMAGGDFISHLDDDDEYLPKRLEKLVACAFENNCDFVWHPYWRETDDDGWELFESPNFARSQVTNASAIYRAWFTRIESSADAYLLMEPGDWNRFRKIKYIRPSWTRFPEPLLKKYR
jgi:hypothetical protein